MAETKLDETTADPSDPYLRQAQTFPQSNADQLKRAKRFGTVETLPQGTVLLARSDTIFGKNPDGIVSFCARCGSVLSPLAPA